MFFSDVLVHAGGKYLFLLLYLFKEKVLKCTLYRYCVSTKLKFPVLSALQHSMYGK